MHETIEQRELTGPRDRTTRGPTILVCGSRVWRDFKRIRAEIAALAPGEVVHGGAPGADSIAAQEAVEWATGEGRGVLVTPFRADWEHDGRSAGPIRNARMLREGKPARGLAFGALWRATAPGNFTPYRLTGTGDMCRRLLAVHLPVRWIESPEALALDLTAMPQPPRSP